MVNEGAEATASSLQKDPGVDYVIEWLFDEAIAALTAAEPRRLEELLASLGQATVPCPTDGSRRRWMLAKRSLLRQLLTETAANLRLLERIANLGVAKEYEYRPVLPAAAPPCG